MRRVRQPGLVVPLELRLEGAHDGLSMALRGRQIFGKLSHLQKICIRDGALVIIQKALGSLPETKRALNRFLECASLRWEHARISVVSSEV